MNIRIIIFSCLSFGAVGMLVSAAALQDANVEQLLEQLQAADALQDANVAAQANNTQNEKVTFNALRLLKFDSALCSAERIVFADALVQPTAKLFKQKLIKAEKILKANEMIWKLQAIPVAVMGGALGRNSWSFFPPAINQVAAQVAIEPRHQPALEQLQDDEARRNYLVPFIIRKAQMNGAGRGSLLAGVASFAWTVPHWKRAAKRAAMYRTFIKHADMLFSVLHSVEFKKRMQVAEWVVVRKNRRIAEFAGLSASVGGAVGTYLLPASTSKWLSAPLNAFFMWGIKPIIAKVIRKRGGVPGLEEEFTKIIEAYERTGFVPYDATVQNNVSGGTTASTTYTGSGMQSTVYAAESARDRYLRLLAERQAAKESQKSE
jgi:hypothetical protein